MGVTHPQLKGRFGSVFNSFAGHWRLMRKFNSAQNTSSTKRPMPGDKGKDSIKHEYVDVLMFTHGIGVRLRVQRRYFYGPTVRHNGAISLKINTYFFSSCHIAVWEGRTTPVAIGHDTRIISTFGDLEPVVIIKKLLEWKNLKVIKDVFQQSNTRKRPTFTLLNDFRGLWL